MWNSCIKYSRLRIALEYRGIDPYSIDVSVLSQVLRRRGITDTVQNRIIWDLLNVLEPPNCTMTHCKSYGGQRYFCNCVEEKIPGRCKIFKDYLKRIAKKEKSRDDIRKRINNDSI